MTISEKGHDGPPNQASDADEQVDNSIEVSIGGETPASENKPQSPYLVSGKPVHNLCGSDWRWLIMFVLSNTQRIFTYTGRRERIILAISIVAAIASGAGIALQNLIFGQFVTTITNFVNDPSASGAKLRHDAGRLS